MRIALVNPPYPTTIGPSAWITVPPQGYGAIQWVCAHLLDGLLALGHEVVLLGAPGSPQRDGLRIVDATSREEFADWAATCDVDIVHDHTNGLMVPGALAGRAAWVSTHHLTGPPRVRRNCVYVSRAQRQQARAAVGPVVPLPVNLRRYRFRGDKDDYLLFLGRVSPHKGTREAAAFAAASGRRLVLAGPAWEPEYLSGLLATYGNNVEVVGEVGGDDRLDLLARATAVLVLSQAVPGPWGHPWREPGATVVSEAAASGTPVVATHNGCLPELAAGVASFVAYGTEGDAATAADAMAALPSPDQVRAIAADRWDHMSIARRYVRLYERVAAGVSWDDDTH